VQCFHHRKSRHHHRRALLCGEKQKLGGRPPAWRVLLDLRQRRDDGRALRSGVEAKAKVRPMVTTIGAETMSHDTTKRKDRSVVLTDRLCETRVAKRTKYYDRETPRAKTATKAGEKAMIHATAAEISRNIAADPELRNSLLRFLPCVASGSPNWR
jgi:hypothetical protein